MFRPELREVLDAWGRRIETAAVDILTRLQPETKAEAKAEGLSARDELTGLAILAAAPSDAVRAELAEVAGTHYLRVHNETIEGLATTMGLAIPPSDAASAAVLEEGGRRMGLVDLDVSAKRRLFSELAAAREAGRGPYEIARRIRDSIPAGRWSSTAVRAKVIARTETMHAQRASQIASFEASKAVRRVMVFDDRIGHGDAVCAGINGKIVSLHEARHLMGTEHPNGTRAYAPYIRADEIEALPDLPAPVLPKPDSLAFLDLKGAYRKMRQALIRRWKPRYRAYRYQGGIGVKLIREKVNDLWGPDAGKALKVALSPEKVAVYQNASEAKVLRMLRENRIRPAELGEQADRVELLEKRLFGMSDAAAEVEDNRPRYGWIGDANGPDNGNMPHLGYGEISIKWKSDAIWDDTTVSLGDSLKYNPPERHAYAPAVRLSNPTREMLDASIYTGTTPLDTPFRPFADTRRAANARKRFSQTGDHRDLIDGSLSPHDPHRYIEAQVFGRRTFDDVEALYVQDVRTAKRLRRELDAAGHEKVEVRYAPTHEQLSALAPDSPFLEYHHAFNLNAADLDRLGDDYLDGLVKMLGPQLLEETHALGVIRDSDKWPWPPTIAKMRAKYGGLTGDGDPVTARFLEVATKTEKRELLHEYYVQRGLREKGALPEKMWRELDESLLGWTAFVPDRKMLKRYPRRIRAPKPRPERAARTAYDLSGSGRTIRLDDGLDTTDLGAAYHNMKRELADEFSAYFDDPAALSPEAWKRAVFEAWGGDPTEQIKRILSAERTAIYVARSENAVIRSINEGRFKNSVEARSSTYEGHMGRERFDKIEKPLYGIADETFEEQPGALPIYGLLADLDNLRWNPIVEADYGPVYVKVKPGARGRATVTLGDSTESNLPDITRHTPADYLAHPSFRLAEGGLEVDRFGGMFHGRALKPRGGEVAADARAEASCAARAT